MIKKISAFSEKKVLFFGFLAISAPLIIVGIYNHPAASDYFVQITLMREHGFWGAQQFFYENTMGRFFTIWLIFSYFHFLEFFGFKIIAPLLITLLFITVYALVRTIIPKEISRSSVLFVVSVIMILYLGYMPSIMEGIFWAAGSLMYQISTILVVLVSTILLKERKIEIGWKKTIARTLATMILVFAIWSHELVMAFALFFLASWLVYEYATKKKIYYYHLFLFFLGILVSLPIIFSPGLTVRQGPLPHVHDFPYTIIQATLYTAKEIFFWILSPALLFLTIILIPLFVKIKRLEVKIPSIMANPWANSVVLVAMLYSVHVASFWSIGFSPLRLQNMLFFFFLILWLYTCFTFISLLADRRPDLIDIVLKIFSSKRVMLAVCIVSVSISFRGSHAVVAMRDLASGIAYRFDQELLHRYKIIRSAPKDTVLHVEPLYNYPTTLFFADITYDEKIWLNDCYARYFGLKGIKINPEAAPPIPIVFKRGQF